MEGWAGGDKVHRLLVIGHKPLGLLFALSQNGGGSRELQSAKRDRKLDGETDYRRWFPCHFDFLLLAVLASH
jgi:hypothetical protein